MDIIKKFIDPGMVKTAILTTIDSPLFAPVALGVSAVAVGGALLATVSGVQPWAQQKPTLTWTKAGIDLLKELDTQLYEGVFGKPMPGDAITSDQSGLLDKFNVFTYQLLDRGLAAGTMKPRTFGLLGTIFDFIFMVPLFLGFFGLLGFGAYGLGTFGVLNYKRSPGTVAFHFFSYCFVLLHTMFVVFAHLGMKNDAKKVEDYNKLGEGARPHVAKPYHYVMWGEQAAGNGPKGSHPYDAHTWPPLVYIPPSGIPLYQKGYILVDLPGLALLAIGSPKAYLAIWGCYLCAALTDHLFLFGGTFFDRLKTVLPVRGINMAQYAFWTIMAHLTSPVATTLAASFTELGYVAAVAVPVHLLMMLAIGARPSRRPKYSKKSA